MLVSIFHQVFHGFQSLFLLAESFLLSAGKLGMMTGPLSCGGSRCGGGSCSGVDKSLYLDFFNGGMPVTEGERTVGSKGGGECDRFARESGQTGIGRTGIGEARLTGEGGEGGGEY